MYTSIKCVLYMMFQKNVIYFCGYHFSVQIILYYKKAFSELILE